MFKVLRILLSKKINDRYVKIIICLAISCMPNIIFVGTITVSNTLLWRAIVKISQTRHFRHWKKELLNENVSSCVFDARIFFLFVLLLEYFNLRTCLIFGGTFFRFFVLQHRMICCLSTFSGGPVTTFWCLRSYLLTERLPIPVVVNMERAIEVAREKKLPTSRTVADDGTALLKGSMGLTICIPVDYSVAILCQVQKMVKPIEITRNNRT